ncbi:Na+/H+ antiporter NhaC family protein [Clostridium sp. Cult2]|uniref:Na+/H+ antiporter NhaC family protein n=1 Tax=Clostridium sp. Cult2 TaxID=2079003 RepID=UPI001F210667|nr:Na+/H+ antiporter NhaC family protein [Clostridium sp. Cult2]MCF6465832.1 sodium:proton antiporter [Clostridium sp. Cult2]
MDGNYGFLSLVPPIIAIVLCFISKNVLLSLIVGVFAGGILMFNGNIFSAIDYFITTMVNSITSTSNTQLLVFTLIMGGSVAFIWKLGGSKALTEWAKNKIKTRKRAGIGAWLLGMIVFFNDYTNSVIVGNVFRDIFKEKKLSSEKLAYILDTTAAPMATLFISDWVAFEIGLLGPALATCGINNASPFSVYVHSIPFNFYAIFGIVFVGIIVITGRDYGPMLKAEYRSYTEDKTTREGSYSMLNVDNELGEPKETKPMIKSFVIPILVLVVITLYGFYKTGLPAENFTELLSNTDSMQALLWGAMAMLITGIIIALLYKIMNINEITDTLLSGFKLMLLACVILVLSWSLAAVTEDMNLPNYLIGLVGESISPVILPSIILIFSMIISFATGTSWGTLAIVTPIAIPMAYYLTGSIEFVYVVTGAVCSGAVFGDHCSPISDTTVLSALFAGGDVIDHVTTQLPYALTCGILDFIVLIIYQSTAINSIILNILGIACLVGISYVLNKYYSKKYGISENYLKSYKAIV